MTPRFGHLTAYLRPALFLLLASPTALVAEEPAPQAQLTAEERRALPAEATRLWEEAQRLDEEGKLAEALAVGEKKVAATRRLIEDDIVREKERKERRRVLAKERNERLDQRPFLRDLEAGISAFFEFSFGLDGLEVFDLDELSNDLIWLAERYERIGDVTTAEQRYREALGVEVPLREQLSEFMSEREQLAIASTSSMYCFALDRYLSHAAQSGNFHPAAYDGVFALKGAVLSRQRAMRAIADRPDLAPTAAALQTTTARLATLALATPKPEEAETRRKQILMLSDEKEWLEEKLAAANKEYRTAHQRTTAKDVQAALPVDGALVDLLEYSYSKPEPQGDDGDWEPRLAAFVLRREGPVRFVDLGSMARIRESIDAWRAGLGNSTESRAAGERLRDRLWLPIEKHLGGAKTVLISPDGAVGTFPFAALPGKKPGTYLLEDYALAVVPAASIVAGTLRVPPGREGDSVGNDGTRSVPIPLTGNLLVLGGVDYNRRSEAIPNEEKPKRRFARRAARDETDQPFSPLPGTRGELATIQKLYQENFGAAGLETLEGADATQEAFVQQAPKHFYLHLATHGFFASPRFKSALDRSAQDRKRHSFLVGPQTISGYHPGLLSGIALAGANQPTEDDDGILTAEEIGSLNLSGCELVVLSACETGLGQTAGGEGLLGVQRAFQVAGARTVIASLWKVDDVATRDLMERFYENLWSRTKADGKPYAKLEALREAQLWMLKERGPRGATPVEADLATAGEKRLPPYYWAAFVLSGDWR